MTAQEAAVFVVPLSVRSNRMRSLFFAPRKLLSVARR